MNEKRVELEIGEDGVIRTIYNDGLEKFAESLGGEISTVCRASNVEWETVDGFSGWTIRAAHDKELAIKDVGSSEPVFVCNRNPENRIALFTKRETALKVEVQFFFKLLPPK